MLRQICDWLYVGAYADSADAEQLQTHSITAVLQLERPIQHEGIETLFLPIPEGLPLHPQTLQRALAFVRDQREAHKTILITCKAGISRSPLLAAVVLKELQAFTLYDAFMLVHAKVPNALPDHVMWESVRTHYQDGPPFWDLWQQLVEL